MVSLYASSANSRSSCGFSGVDVGVGQVVFVVVIVALIKNVLVVAVVDVVVVILLTKYFKMKNINNSLKFICLTNET